ncbi:hypothetical protein PoMZ_02901 [Pyricularia oryzae]|uniref:Uncharacterized protein n=1 Tax=Pyricularia oryzae TaxID=318829 RepID=A0A4P7N6G2_PYROR|nr:hypothetical protein PoMZ_02901 [Pyricularia oryzae]
MAATLMEMLVIANSQTPRRRQRLVLVAEVLGLEL